MFLLFLFPPLSAPLGKFKEKVNEGKFVKSVYFLIIFFNFETKRCNKRLFQNIMDRFLYMGQDYLEATSIKHVIVKPG